VIFVLGLYFHFAICSRVSALRSEHIRFVPAGLSFYRRPLGRFVFLFASRLWIPLQISFRARSWPAGRACLFRSGFVLDFSVRLILRHQIPVKLEGLCLDLDDRSTHRVTIPSPRFVFAAKSCPSRSEIPST
jgi:hypothetical protein